MNNERYNQIIDEAYENYTAYMNSNWMETRWNKTWISDDGKSVNGRRYKKEEFIDKIKTDQEFSERWKLKIEEKELSLGERGELFTEKYPNNSVDDFRPNGMEVQSLTHQLVTRYNNANIPTKLITLTYNNETIEVYEY
jgi:hypothetical protein